MKNAAVTLTASLFSLTFALGGVSHAADAAHAADPAHGHAVHEPRRASSTEVPLVAPEAETAPNNTFYGQIGTGATAPGTAGGGTATTNRAHIGASSYGILPDWARVEVATSATAPLLTAPGFATAPGHQMSAAFQPVPAGALGTFVRDHSLPAHPAAPAPGGYYRANSVPSTQIGAGLSPYHASPEARSLAGEVPHHESNEPAH